MPQQGFVVGPDGKKTWVPDKWAYFYQHPESFQATLDSMNDTNTQDEAAKPGHPPYREKSPRPFQYCCVDKYVLKDCPDCKASL